VGRVDREVGAGQLVVVVVAAAVVEVLADLDNKLHKQDEKNGTHFVANPISSPDLSR